jgi:hypothetical protein
MAAVSDEQPAPLLRVVKGDPTPEEVAALVAVIASMSAPEAPAPRPVSSWADPARGVRTTLPHGPGAWRASGLPR